VRSIKIVGSVMTCTEALGPCVVIRSGSAVRAGASSRPYSRRDEYQSAKRVCHVYLNLAGRFSRIAEIPSANSALA
jgi:hypothetical protein